MDEIFKEFTDLLERIQTRLSNKPNKTPQEEEALKFIGEKQKEASDILISKLEEKR